MLRWKGRCIGEREREALMKGEDAGLGRRGCRSEALRNLSAHEQLRGTETAPSAKPRVGENGLAPGSVIAQSCPPEEQGLRQKAAGGLGDAGDCRLLPGHAPVSQVASPFLKRGLSGTSVPAYGASTHLLREQGSCRSSWWLIPSPREDLGAGWKLRQYCGKSVHVKGRQRTAAPGHLNLFSTRGFANEVKTSTLGHPVTCLSWGWEKLAAPLPPPRPQAAV